MQNLTTGIFVICHKAKSDKVTVMWFIYV